MVKKVIEMDITKKCLNKCPYCYNKDSDDYADMTLNQFIKNLNMGIKEGCSECLLIGGEPLLHPLLINFLKECNDKNMESTVWTSGTVPCDDILELCDNLIISRNALTDADCSRIYGNKVIPKDILKKYSKKCNVIITTLHNTKGVNGNLNANIFKKYYGDITTNPIEVISYKVRSSSKCKPRIKFDNLELPVGMIKRKNHFSENRYYANEDMVYRLYVPIK